MPWPLSQDYNEAVQNPQSSFADAELRGGQAALNAFGMPLPRSGNFADVYELTGASGNKWAVKCFTRAVSGLQERYHEISLHLQQATLPFTVDFQYLPQGIRVQGQWYPILKMHWVEGFLLNDFVRQNLDKPKVLEGLCNVWVRMAKRLREAKVAHRKGVQTPWAENAVCEHADQGGYPKREEMTPTMRPDGVLRTRHCGRSAHSAQFEGNRAANSALTNAFMRG